MNLITALKHTTSGATRLVSQNKTTWMFQSRGERLVYVAQLALGLVQVLAMTTAIGLFGTIAQAIITVQPIARNATLMVVFTVVAALARGVRQWLATWAAGMQEEGIRQRLAAIFGSSTHADRSQEVTGKRVDMSINGAEKIALYRQWFLPDVTISLVSPLVIALIIAVRHSTVVGVTLLIVIPFIPITLALFSQMTREVSAGSRKARGRLAAHYLEALQFLRSLVLLNAAARKAEELARIGEDNRQHLMRLLRGNQQIILVMDLMFSLAIITIGTALTIYQGLIAAISLGDVITILILLTLFLEPINQVGAFFYVGMGGIAMQRAIGPQLAGRFTTPVPLSPTPEGYEHNIPPRMASAQQVPAPGDASMGLALHDVTYAYEADGQAVLAGLSHTFAPGSRTAIIGPSGTGKSTLLSLLAGDMQATSGEVQWVEATTRPASEAELLRLTAYVGQTTWLFTGSLAYNLRIGNPEATDAELWDVLEQTQLASFVHGLEHGLDTTIGERGAGLSGGQAQRLSIARALLSRRPVLLLDEPTSQVDIYAQAKIMEVIAHLDRRLTIIMVTHRLEAVADMDTTLTLAHEDGQTTLIPAVQPDIDRATSAAQPETGRPAAAPQPEIDGPAAAPHSTEVTR